MDYINKKIVIVGLGKTGLSCVDYFIAKGLFPRVVDIHPKPDLSIELNPNIETHFGGLPENWLTTADLIIVSPGVALTHPILLKAAACGAEIMGDIELFCREIKQRPEKKIVAITGANGKTTVTSLVAEIAQAANISTVVGGNIGFPVLSLLDQEAELYVLELSSFQLESTKSLNATIATILNISEDHMDRYPLGLSQYAEAKQRIFQNVQYAIVNLDDPMTIPSTPPHRGCVTYGRLEGDYHLDCNFQHLMANGIPVLATREMTLIGLHNYINALVALAISDLLGIGHAISTGVLKTFAGLPHRFELVHENHGVRWINDSKATNVGSAKAALDSVVCDGHLYLLLGGDGKCADFAPLLSSLDRKCLTIYAFGQDASKLAQLNPKISHEVDTLAEAIADIAPRLEPGDVVLLSPACASLDQFKNYIERGDTFRRLAKEYGR